MSSIKITGRQVKAARGLLDLSQEDLCAATGVSLGTISNFENGRKVPKEETVEAVRSSLERRGIIFANGDKPSVTLDPSKAIIPPT